MTAVMKPLVEDRDYEPIADCAYSCDNCGRLNIATWRTTWNSGNNGEPPPLWEGIPPERQNVVWHPIATLSVEFPDVPVHIANAATEATLCLSVQAYRAACALARAVVEATAKDKGCDMNSAGKPVPLVGMIDEMCTRSLIRPAIRDAAHEIRHLGNDMAHGDFTDPVTSEEAEEIIALMGLVLDEVYQSVALIESRRNARQSKKTTPVSP
jgi:hypothetical protein